MIIRQNLLFTSGATSIFRMYPMRAAVAVLSLAIGIAAIVTILSLSYTLRDSLTSTFRRLDSSSVIVRSNPSYDDVLTGDASGLEHADYAALKHALPDALSIAPKLRYGGWQTRADLGRHSMQTVLYGSNHALLNAAAIALESGRFLTVSDEAAQANVCVLGRSVASTLAPNGPVIGSYLHVGPTWCRVIGVLGASGAALGFDYDNQVIAPIGLIEKIPESLGQLDLEIHVLFPAAVSDQAAEMRIRNAITRTRRAEGRAGTPFLVITGDALGEYLDQTMKPVKLGLLGLVLITFLIGGFGVMSVMLATVRARTAEIGLRRAVGASKAAIFFQFITESTTISFAGGCLGILVGSLILFVVTHTTSFFGSFVLPFAPLAASVVLAVLGGIAFGTGPAWIAARMNPAHALGKR